MSSSARRYLRRIVAEIDDLLVLFDGGFGSGLLHFFQADDFRHFGHDHFDLGLDHPFLGSAGCARSPRREGGGVT